MVFLIFFSLGLRVLSDEQVTTTFCIPLLRIANSKYLNKITKVRMLSPVSQRPELSDQDKKHGNNLKMFVFPPLC